MRTPTSKEKRNKINMEKILEKITGKSLIGRDVLLGGQYRNRSLNFAKCKVVDVCETSFNKRFGYYLVVEIYESKNDYGELVHGAKMTVPPNEITKIFPNNFNEKHFYHSNKINQLKMDIKEIKNITYQLKYYKEKREEIINNYK